jgi:hypothetical protein
MPHVEFNAIFVERRRELVFGAFCGQNRVSRPIFSSLSISQTSVAMIECPGSQKSRPKSTRGPHVYTLTRLFCVNMTTIPWSDKRIPQKMTLFYQKSSSYDILNE